MSRRAIISGGSRGIGLAVARKFLKHDIAVTLVASNEDNLRSASEELRKISSSSSSNAADLVSYSVCNLAVKEEVEQCCGQLVKKGSGVDILVNAAGVTYNKLLVTASVEQIRKVLDVNLLGTMLFTKSIVRQMIRQKRPGAIVTIGSIIGAQGNIGQTAYAASKAGLSGFTKSLAKELESKGITANLVSPGFIKTDMTADSLKPAQIEDIRATVPLQRLGSADEVASVTFFLANSPYITGQELTVDGGLSLVF